LLPLIWGEFWGGGAAKTLRDEFVPSVAILGGGTIYACLPQLAVRMRIDETRRNKLRRSNGQKNWAYPSKQITIKDGQEQSNHFIQAYTDGSKNEEGVGSGVAIFAGTELISPQKYRLNQRC